MYLLGCGALSVASVYSCTVCVSVCRQREYVWCAWASVEQEVVVNARARCSQPLAGCELLVALGERLSDDVLRGCDW